MNIQDTKQYTIYEKEINGVKYYRLQLSKKMQDGTYQNGYVDIKFAKCEAPENKTKIYLKNAWWSFYLNKDKHTIPYVVCMEYETTEQVIRDSKKDIVKQNTEDTYKDLGTSVKMEDIEIDDELLPF